MATPKTRKPRVPTAKRASNVHQLPPPSERPFSGNVEDLPMVTGWGRTGVHAREIFGEDLERLTEHAVLSRGLGRAYGDSALPPPSHPEVVATPLADRLISFDPKTGIFRAEAGMSLCEMNRFFMPKGWFTPVSPGTMYVTLGGMVAADVHGKNHHVDATFGRHVRSLKMRVADGSILEVNRRSHPDLFRATLGGMGLTGHILEVEVQLVRIPSPWIYQETERIENIDEFIAALKKNKEKWPFTVGWIDCLSTGSRMGRGILMCGRWALPSEAPSHKPGPKRRIAIPFDFPEWLLGPWTVRAFNWLYYWKHWQRKRKGCVHPETFFYPLDAILSWNRMYGRRGFTQYQCVLPESSGPNSARRFLDLLTTKGGASFLCVIKDCGPEGEGLLSFPKPGISIALDIAIRDNTPDLVKTLNRFVIAEGGRVYLAKDIFTTPEDFRAMEPRFEEWQAIRRKWDPEGRFRSAQSVRLFGDRP